MGASSPTPPRRPRKPSSNAVKVAITGGAFALVAAVIGIIPPLLGSRPSPSPTISPSPGLSPTPTPEPSPVALPKVVIVDSANRKRGTLDKIQTALEQKSLGHFEVVWLASLIDWEGQCLKLARASPPPRVLLVHWHALRPDFAKLKSQERDQRAEEALMQGLRSLREESPTTNIVLYSRSFAKQTEPASRHAVAAAGRRLSTKTPELKVSYDELASVIATVPWSDSVTPDRAEVDKLWVAVRTALSQ
jgi:hypothetical protein